MKVPLSLCEQRDPKGLYKKARAGQLKGFTGAPGRGCGAPRGPRTCRGTPWVASPRAAAGGPPRRAAAASAAPARALAPSPGCPPTDGPPSPASRPSTPQLKPQPFCQPRHRRPLRGARGGRGGAGRVRRGGQAAARRGHGARAAAVPRGAGLLGGPRGRGVVGGAVKPSWCVRRRPRGAGLAAARARLRGLQLRSRAAAAAACVRPLAAAGGGCECGKRAAWVYGPLRTARDLPIQHTHATRPLSQRVARARRGCKRQRRAPQPALAEPAAAAAFFEACHASTANLRGRAPWKALAGSLLLTRLLVDNHNTCNHHVQPLDPCIIVPVQSLQRVRQPVTLAAAA